MPVTLTREPSRDSEFKTITVQLRRDQHDWLRTCADTSYLTLSARARQVFDAAMALDERIAA